MSTNDPRELREVPWKPKRCGCGRVHETIEAWRELPPAAGGLHYSDEYEISEYRNCSCGSTIVVMTRAFLESLVPRCALAKIEREDEVSP